MRGVEPNTPPVRKRRSQELVALQMELQSRVAEAEWLKQHYDEQLRAAFAQIASLQARLRPAGGGAEPASAPSAADTAELAALKAEAERLRQAESRYLDRINELKEIIVRHGGSAG